MDGMSIMLFTLPVLYPLLVTSLGFDPILLGILMVILTEVAMITPPVGLNLFVIQGVTGVDLVTIARGILPFFLGMLVIIVLITHFPQLALFLPAHIIGK